jgi:translation initiation factor 2B subunit (eIF-2B alpha/beta/delta family)
MATKMAFTSAEWQTLQWAVTDTMTYLSLADPGFWDMFKEANAAAHYIAAAKQTSESVLVRELAADIRTKRDKEVSGNPTNVSGEVIERVNEAVKIVSAKAPEDLEGFKAFIIGVAKATAQAAKGTGPTELRAISKLEKALG